MLCPQQRHLRSGRAICRPRPGRRPLRSHFWLEFGPRFGPPFTTVTKRRLYTRRFLALPVRTFFFSALATLGVWFFTLPARARLPCTLPMTAACVRAGAGLPRPAVSP